MYSFVLKKDKQMEFVLGIIFLVGGRHINQLDIYLRIRKGGLSGIQV